MIWLYSPPLAVGQGTLEEVIGLWLVEVGVCLLIEVGCYVLVQVLVRKILGDQVVYFLKICFQANIFWISWFFRRFRNLSWDDFNLIVC